MTLFPRREPQLHRWRLSAFAAAMTGWQSAAAKAAGLADSVEQFIPSFPASAAIGALSTFVLWQWWRSRALRARLAASRAQTRQLATHDSLLGLPNRIHFRFALDDAFADRAKSGPHGLLYIDLDRFKDVNDSHGHEIGDRLLLAFTRRMRMVMVELASSRPIMSPGSRPPT